MAIWRYFGTKSLAGSLDALSQQASRVRGVLRAPSSVRKVEHSESTLIVMVGWIMGKQKHLAKYAQLYNDLGYPTLTLEPSIFHFWDILSSSTYTTKVTRLLDDNFRGSIALHLPSGSANVILPTFAQNAASFKNIELKGLVFDCGPALFSYESGTAAAKTLYKGGGMSTLSYLSANAVGITVEKLKGAKIRRETEIALRTPVLSVPQLYLYSDSDPVVPPERVQRVMEEQRELGRPHVEGVLFEGAPHVRLALSQPDLYRNKIESFLARITKT